MTKLEEMMEAHEDAIKMSKEWNCSYDEAFRKVWDCVWYDEDGEASGGLIKRINSDEWGCWIFIKNLK